MKNIIYILLISFALAGCKANHEVPEVYTRNSEAHLYNYIKSLIVANSGLVSSRTIECYTTVYKNSLAAMAFIHEGDSMSAQGILDVFENYYSQKGSNFSGFPQVWDACTGLPANSNYWEGDNAFLLLSLNYYSTFFSKSVKYNKLRQGLADWLFQRADSSATIVSEGLADMYAALAPFDAEGVSHSRLTKIRNNFYSAINLQSVLDHTIRAALVFCDTSGYAYLENFLRTDTWVNDDSTVVTAFSAFQGDAYINLEISAQMLLTDEIYGKDKLISRNKLLGEFSKLSLESLKNPEATGIPYFVITPPGVYWYPATKPIIDPSCYVLFYYWKFNPFAPGKNAAGSNRNSGFRVPGFPPTLASTPFDSPSTPLRVQLRVKLSNRLRRGISFF